LLWVRPRRPRGGGSGAELAAGHLGLDLALSLDVLVDPIAQLVGLWRVEMNLLLEDVAQAPARHADVVEILHQHERIHSRQVAGFVHQLHGAIVWAAAHECRDSRMLP